MKMLGIIWPNENGPFEIESGRIDASRLEPLASGIRHQAPGTSASSRISDLGSCSFSGPTWDIFWK